MPKRRSTGDWRRPPRRASCCAKWPNCSSWPNRRSRIEIYDNSHISGSNALGAMVVAGPEGFIKNQYRKFNIKQAATDDDFAMMREVFQRRFGRLVEESVAPAQAGAAGSAEQTSSGPRLRGGDEDVEPEWPDLVLIDGGKGQ